MKSYGPWINGDHVDDEAEFTRTDPATAEPLYELVLAGEAIVDRAVASARAAFPRWAEHSAEERGLRLLKLADLIEEHSEELARTEAVEAGKPITVARGDVSDAVRLTRMGAGLAMTQPNGTAHTQLGSKIALVVREPVGVAALITAWNFPLTTLFQKLPFALAAGCTAVVKPSELTSGTTLKVAELVGAAGFGPGVVNVVTGAGPTGELLVQHPDVDLVSFTGSTKTGRSIAAVAAESVKRLTLELGGKAAAVVFPDADLQATASGIAYGALFNQGQCCVAGTRLLVHRDVEEELVAMVVKEMARWRVGAPLDPDTDLGPMIHPEHLESVAMAVEMAVRAGATCVSGGRRAEVDSLPHGSFWEPTVLTDVRVDDICFQEEIFGPVLTVTAFDSELEAIEMTNAVRYGLANSVWTRDSARGLRLASAMRSGTVWVNSVVKSHPQVPFGGFGQSGLGREKSSEGLDAFTDVKCIQVETDPEARFPLPAGA